MPRQVRFRLAEHHRRLRRRLTIWRRRDPKPWVVALLGMALGLCLLLPVLAWIGVLRLIARMLR